MGTYGNSLLNRRERQLFHVDQRHLSYYKPSPLAPAVAPPASSWFFRCTRQPRPIRLLRIGVVTCAATYKACFKLVS